MLRTLGRIWRLPGLAGILTLLVGTFFCAFADDGATRFVWLFGMYAILFGVMMVLCAFRLRRMGDTAD